MGSGADLPHVGRRTRHHHPVKNPEALAAHSGQREKDLAEGYDEAARIYRNELDLWKRDREAILGKRQKPGAERGKALEALGPEPQAPTRPFVVMTEPTWEGLVKLLPEVVPSLGLFSAEGGGFLGGHGMSQDAKARTAAGLSEVWDGVPIKRVRGGDGASVHPGRRLSVHLMVQPEIAKLLTKDALIAGAGGQGMHNRFLMVAPESTAGTRAFRDLDPASERDLGTFAAHILSLLSKPMPTEPGRHQVLKPRALPLSAQARALWIGFHDSNEAELAPGGTLAPIVGLANKMPEHAARLAAVLTLIEDINAPKVTADAMANGIHLAQHYAHEALRQAQAADVPQNLLDAEKLRRWLLEKRTEPLVSVPDICQRGPNALRSAEAARAAVGVLVQHGWLVPAEGEVGGKRRREVWRCRRAP